MAEIDPWTLMKEGFDNQQRTIWGRFEQMDSQALASPILTFDVSLEESTGFTPGTPKEQIYRYLGGLDARSWNPHACISPSYIPTALRAYQEILPLVDHPQVKLWVRAHIEGLEQSVKIMDNNWAHCNIVPDHLV